MDVAPLFAAPLAVKLHVATLLSAAAISVVQFTAPKGTVPHRTLGYLFVALMLATATSSFFIREPGGGFAVSHLFIPGIIVFLALGLWFARRGNIAGHRLAMTILCLGSFVGAGTFAVLRGRIVQHILFGG